MCSPYNDLTRDPENRRLICALCIEWVSYDDLHVLEDGLKIDVCESCHLIEMESLLRHECGQEPFNIRKGILTCKE